MSSSHPTFDFSPRPAPRRQSWASTPRYTTALCSRVKDDDAPHVSVLNRPETDNALIALASSEEHPRPICSNRSSAVRTELVRVEVLEMGILPMVDRRRSSSSTCPRTRVASTRCTRSTRPSARSRPRSPPPLPQPRPRRRPRATAAAARPRPAHRFLTLFGRSGRLRRGARAGRRGHARLRSVAHGVICPARPLRRSPGRPRRHSTRAPARRELPRHAALASPATLRRWCCPRRAASRCGSGAATPGTWGASRTSTPRASSSPRARRPRRGELIDIELALSTSTHRSRGRDDLPRGAGAGRARLAMKRARAAGTAGFFAGRVRARNPVATTRPLRALLVISGAPPSQPSRRHRSGARYPTALLVAVSLSLRERPVGSSRSTSRRAHVRLLRRPATRSPA